MAEKILVVDDSNLIVEGLSSIFRYKKYETWKACSGQECLEILEKHIPDIIILDILMEPMDGWETLGKIRDNPKTREIPVLMFSAKNISDEEEEQCRVTIDEFVAKPVTSEQLVNTVDQVLLRRRAAREIAERWRSSGISESRIAEYLSLKANIDIEFHLSSILKQEMDGDQAPRWKPEEFLQALNTVEERIKSVSPLLGMLPRKESSHKIKIVEKNEDEKPSPHPEPEPIKEEKVPVVPEPEKPAPVKEEPPVVPVQKAVPLTPKPPQREREIKPLKKYTPSKPVIPEPPAPVTRVTHSEPPAEPEPTPAEIPVLEPEPIPETPVVQEEVKEDMPDPEIVAEPVSLEETPETEEIVQETPVIAEPEVPQEPEPIPVPEPMMEPEIPELVKPVEQKPPEIPVPIFPSLVQTTPEPEPEDEHESTSEPEPVVLTPAKPIAPNSPEDLIGKLPVASRTLRESAKSQEFPNPNPAPVPTQIDRKIKENHARQRAEAKEASRQSFFGKLIESIRSALMGLFRRSKN